MNNKYINSKIIFYLPEIIIFCIYFIVYFFASIKEQGFLLGGLMFGGVGFIFFIIEHRTDLVLDKINNIIFIRNKMLFLNKYIIKEQFALSDMSNADIITITNYDSKEKRYSYTYKLRILKKDGTIFLPFGGWSDNSQKKWQEMADKINHFNQSHEPVLIITRKPFFFRLCFGVLFGFFYFLVGMGIIFPKEIEPIIYHMLNILFSINGYHQ